MGMPAARLGDKTAHGDPLKPGTCSPDVFISGQPAWRALSPAMVQKLLDIFKDTVKNATKAIATANTPAQAEPLKKMKEGVEELLKIMASTDQHACTIVKLVIPDGNGVVINGSTSVFINGLPACRVGDMIIETTSVNSIAKGDNTVLIGSGSSAALDPDVASAIQEKKEAEAEAKKKEEAEKAAAEG
ncbi:MAG: PAAR domain-containing protein [Elainellaceae cyanobacterium]